MFTNPTEILSNEHRVIEKVLGAMGFFAQALTSGEAIDEQKLAGLVPFMREFADAHHHAKEEHLLFPKLVANGLPASNGPVQAMCAEHQIGRGQVSRLENAIQTYLAKQSGSDIDLADAMKTIIDFYTHHIWKEDNVLFPMANQILSAEDMAKLLVAFTEKDAVAGPSARERFVEYADSLC